MTGQNNNTSSVAETFLNIAVAVAVYTIFGGMSYGCYALAATEIHALPMIGVGAFIGLWWLWIFILLPVMVLFSSILVQMLKKKDEGSV